MQSRMHAVWTGAISIACGIFYFLSLLKISFFTLIWSIWISCNSGPKKSCFHNRKLNSHRSGLCATKVRRVCTRKFGRMINLAKTRKVSSIMVPASSSLLPNYAPKVRIFFFFFSSSKLLMLYGRRLRFENSSRVV